MVLGRTALHGACREDVGDDVMDLVLSYSPRLDERGGDGYTALYRACRYNRLGAVQRLVTAGASLEVKNDDGDTPLHLAAIFASSDVVDVLLQAGACVDAVDDYGHTPLHDAVVYIHVYLHHGHQHRPVAAHPSHHCWETWQPSVEASLPNHSPPGWLQQ